MLEKRRDALARAWALGDELVLIGAGDLVPVPGTDQTYDYRAHPEFRYLADCECPGAVLAFDPLGDGWTLHTPTVSREDRFWLGSPAVAGEPLERLAVAGRRVAGLGCPVPSVPTDDALSARLREAVDRARLVKDDDELARLRLAARATVAGHEAARRAVRPGMTERALKGVLEAGFLAAGGERPAFTSIVAGGPNSAVLHFEPSARPLAAGELVLVDAGTTVGGYGADVTRTFSVAGELDADQRALWQLVHDVNRATIGRCRPGAEWREVHLAACRELAAGLVDFGLLRGDPDALVDRDAHALFMPHGIGHLLGIDVHDAGGYLDGRRRSDRFGLAFLRADVALQPGYVVTVEPGIYLIPELLRDPEFRERFRDDVVWDRADAMLGFGGIRIEEDVHVTAGEPEVLTAGDAA